MIHKVTLKNYYLSIIYLFADMLKMEHGKFKLSRIFVISMRVRLARAIIP